MRSAPMSVLRGINVPSAYLRGAAQVSFDILDLLIEFRRSAELIGVANARRVVGEAPLAVTAVKLFGLAANRYYLLQRDVLMRARKEIDPKDMSYAGKGLIQQRGVTMAGSAPRSAANPLRHQIHLSAKQGSGRISIDLRLKNSRPGAEMVQLTAAPLRLFGGTQIVLGRITIDPAVVELPAAGECLVKVNIDVTQEFRPGHAYEGAIVIEAMYGKRIPLIIMIEPSETSPINAV